MLNTRLDRHRTVEHADRFEAEEGAERARVRRLRVRRRHVLEVDGVNLQPKVLLDVAAERRDDLGVERFHDVFSVRLDGLLRLRVLPVPPVEETERVSEGGDHVVEAVARVVRLFVDVTEERRQQLFAPEQETAVAGVPESPLKVAEQLDLPQLPPHLRRVFRFNHRSHQSDGEAKADHLESRRGDRVTAP